MQNKVLEIEKLNALYDSGQGVKNINLSVNEGEFIALVGHNGAGKTTIMNSILGLKEYEGDIKLKYKYNDIGYVSQLQVMDWYLNVEDNIYMEQIILDRYNKEENQKIIKLLEVEKILKTSVEDLSGGQIQRVIVARALLKYPELYILDEPTTSLDIISSENLLEYLKELSKSNKTIIISSHDIELIEKYCERIILIKEGKIKYDGSTEDFCNNKSLRNKLLEEMKND